MENLVILGAGGSSREIAEAVREINRRQPRWDLRGFLDDDPARQGTRVDHLPVLGSLDCVRSMDAQVILGVARARDRGIRPGIVERLNLPLDRYASVIHPAASVSAHASVGAGTAILHNAVITPGTSVGNHVLICQNVTMADDQVVEDFVTIAPGAVIAGYARLERGCYIGAGSRILDRITIHENALVGIGAVVIQDVPAGATVFGNPARAVRSADK